MHRRGRDNPPRHDGRPHRQLPVTARTVAVTEHVLPGGGDWAPCHCCGRSYPATNMVRFQYHPDDALCVSCVAWLYDRSRPIARKLYPIWPWLARIRARMTAAR